MSHANQGLNVVLIGCLEPLYRRALALHNIYHLVTPCFNKGNPVHLTKHIYHLYRTSASAWLCGCSVKMIDVFGGASQIPPLKRRVTR
jgi:hypothetical protein